MRSNENSANKRFDDAIDEKLPTVVKRRAPMTYLKFKINKVLN
ncbi:MAG TPA: hypothetical protein VH796_01055 [Nitrososphaeraceae archaeon]|jgi:hypothetical protein